MKIISLENTELLAIALNRENADFDSVKITCHSVDNSPTGVMFTAKYKVAQKNGEEPGPIDNKQSTPCCNCYEQCSNHEAKRVCEAFPKCYE